MNREILEILACPIDKFHPLDLFECKTEIEKIVIILGVKTVGIV